MKSIRYFSVVLSIALFSALHPVSAQEAKMGVRMYVRVVGAKQGVFKPTPKTPNLLGDGFIELTNVSFNEETPADAPHYKDKGVTQHQTLKITKQVDAASPQFLMASMNNEAFSSVILKFIRPNEVGTVSIFMTLTLKGASISDFKQNGSSETISIKYSEMKLEEPGSK